MLQMQPTIKGKQPFNVILSEAKAKPKDLFFYGASFYWSMISACILR